MKLPSVLILYILIPFENAVNCKNTEYIRSMISALKKRYNVVNSSETEDYNFNIDDFDGIIRANIPYITSNTKAPLSKQYVYKIHGAYQSLLSYPNTIDRIKFNNFIMEFDENTRFPYSKVDYIYLYTCEHGKPILMYLSSGTKIYIYSPYSKTRKWTNYTLRYDERFRKLSDSDDLEYYECIHGSLGDLYSRDFENYKYEEKELIKELYSYTRCPNAVTDSNNTLEIHTKPSKIFMPLCIYCDFFAFDKLTLLFKFDIYISHKKLLSYPNKVDRIKYAEHIMEFDENAILPNTKVDYIYVYSCMHFTPVMLVMENNSKLYYYSLDKNTNKWTNYKLTNDEKFTRHTDENGIIYYEKLDSEEISLDDDDDNHDPIKLVEELCDNNTCPREGRVVDVFLKIKMK